MSPAAMAAHMTQQQAPTSESGSLSLSKVAHSLPDLSDRWRGPCHGHHEDHQLLLLLLRLGRRGSLLRPGRQGGAGEAGAGQVSRCQTYYTDTDAVKGRPHLLPLLLPWSSSWAYEQAGAGGSAASSASHALVATASPSPPAPYASCST